MSTFSLESRLIKVSSTTRMVLSQSDGSAITDKSFTLGVGSQCGEVVIQVPVNHTDCTYIPEGKPSARRERVLNIFAPEIQYINISCVNLDEFLSENDIHHTFIKMDIEGTEMDALKGAEQTIKQLKPKLAICLYHHDSDMWEIPLFIKSIVHEYKIFCRENKLGCEFVLYATTEEQSS